MTARLVWSLLIVCVFTLQARCVEPVPEIQVEDFGRLLATIKPQPGESPWREIPWLTNVTEARRQAIAEDKPLVIFTAADGSALSRT